jgi:hypothetical protein
MIFYGGMMRRTQGFCKPQPIHNTQSPLASLNALP